MSFTHHKLIAAANGEDEARSRFERMITECVVGQPYIIVD